MSTETETLAEFVREFDRKSTFLRLAGQMTQHMAGVVNDAMANVLDGNPEELIEVPASWYAYFELHGGGRARSGDIVSWYRECLGDLA